ncbi:MAG: outer membrane beta-barrel protein [Chitinophagaceae bacterium]|nr:outer membrane beta-barrel protein [Chitinophagaceae bacterium]
MNKDLHDIDDLFRSALDPYEETPSTGLKKSLEAALDKKDAQSSKRKFILWKRTALISLLLLSGFALFETGVFKTSQRAGDEMKLGSKRKAEKIPAKSNSTGHEMNTHSDKPVIKLNNDKKNEIAFDISSSTLKTRKGDALSGISKRNQQAGFNNNVSEHKTGLQKNNLRKELVNLLSEEEEQTTAGIKNVRVASDNNFLKNQNLLQNEKNDLLQFFKGSRVGSVSDGVANNINQLQDITDSLSNNNILKNKRAGIPDPFKSFWMVNTFISYERAGYRLDSDLPINITNIKHSEIHEPSFSLGILATRQIKKRWGLQTGLIYCLTNIGISPQKLYALQDPVGDISYKYITSSGYAYIKPGLGVPPALGDSLITKEGKHSLKFISVPLVLKYSVGKNKLILSPGIGIEANFLTKAKVETEVESPSNPEIIFIRKLDGAKTFHLSFVADAELRYKLNNKLSVSARPAIRLATTQMTKNNVVETFPRSFGLGLGLTYKF